MTVSIYFSERRVWWGNTYHRISDFWINQPLSSLLGPEFPEIPPHSIYIRVWVWLGHLTVIEIKEKKEQTREINGRKPGKEYIKLSRIRKFSYHRNIFRAYKPSHSLKTTPIGVINREIQRERQTRIIYTEWKMDADDDDSPMNHRGFAVFVVETGTSSYSISHSYSLIDDRGL